MTARQKSLGTNGQLGLRRPRFLCGFCGFEVTVNRNGAMRIHGPLDDRCVGSNLSLKAVVAGMHKKDPVSGVSSMVKGYPLGRCAVCGDNTFGVEDAHQYMRKHDHRRPRIIREDDMWSVSWFSYSNRAWRRRYAATHEEAMTIVRKTKER